MTREPTKIQSTREELKKLASDYALTYFTEEPDGYIEAPPVKADRYYAYLGVLTDFVNVIFDEADKLDGSDG